MKKCLEAPIYERLLHYCSLDTLRSIMSNKTLRCTNLKSAKLNDQFESKRMGVEDFAVQYYIVCFSHCPYEIVPFWYNYGGYDNKKKVLLRIKNFAQKIPQVICDDFGLLPDGKRLFFNPKESNTSSFIRNISMFDIKYFPIEHQVFSQNYYQEPAFFPDVLGRFKTIHWGYEEETRLLFYTERLYHCVGEYIDLRLFDEFFKDLEIVINPWADNNLQQQVFQIIDQADFPENVKASIKVLESELKNQIANM